MRPYIFIGWALAAASVSSASTCEVVLNSEQAEQYLRPTATVKTSECTSKAVTILADSKHGASEMFIAYLGVVRSDLNGFFAVSEENAKFLFPALERVVSGGKSVEPRLIAAVSSDLDLTVRRNATRALRFIYNGDDKQLVAVLKAAAAKTHRTEEKRALEEGARWVAAWSASRLDIGDFSAKGSLP